MSSPKVPDFPVFRALSGNPNRRRVRSGLSAPPFSPAFSCYFGPSQNSLAISVTCRPVRPNSWQRLEVLRLIDAISCPPSQSVHFRVQVFAGTMVFESGGCWPDAQRVRRACCSDQEEGRSAMRDRRCAVSCSGCEPVKMASISFGERKANGRMRLTSESSVALIVATSVRLRCVPSVSCRRYRCARRTRSTSAGSGLRAWLAPLVRIRRASTPRRLSVKGQSMRISTPPSPSSKPAGRSKRAMEWRSTSRLMQPCRTEMRRKSCGSIARRD